MAKTERATSTHRIIVTHSYYGCDTGCCGHVIEVNGTPGDFNFAHPQSSDENDCRAFAEELVRKAGCDPADIDWLHSIILDDD